MATKLSKHLVFLNMALVLSKLSTCSRRNVGCILVDRNNKIIGSGYNGVASGMPHCINKPCGGINFKSGDGLEECEAIHAEQNALMQCNDVTKIRTAYVNTSPCKHCTKMLLNTGCNTIVFKDEYSNSGHKLWTEAKRDWIQI